MVLTIVAPVMLSLLVRLTKSRKLARAVCWMLTIVLLVNELVEFSVAAKTLGAVGFLRQSLPLHLCGVAVYLIVFALMTGNRTAFELAFFWGLAGTAQAIITPDVDQAFPSYVFAKYFIRHCGIVVAVLFAVWGLKMRPRPKSPWVAMIICNIYMVIVAPINYLLGSNYLFICAKPDAPSPFFFWPWPWYILFIEALGVVLFWLLYAPFPLADRIRRGRLGSRS
ncbi:MAG: TIGR02206 family membrane protein [Planctomycetes bacterium]|nr:TIGR02206 family membrane protein [Planctomycetota bacterium]